MWACKVLVNLLLGRKSSLFKAVEIKGRIYIIDIREYEPSEIMIRRMESILNAEEIQDAKV